MDGQTPASRGHLAAARGANIAAQECGVEGTGAAESCLLCGRLGHLCGHVPWRKVTARGTKIRHRAVRGAKRYSPSCKPRRIRRLLLPGDRPPRTRACGRAETLAASAPQQHTPRGQRFELRSCGTVHVQRTAPVGPFFIRTAICEVQKPSAIS